MFYYIAERINRSFHTFHPFPAITDRYAWSSLDQEWHEAAVALGEKYLCFSFPYISATDFMEFLSTGNRSRYEDKLFSKRHALNALVLAECAENKGRFLNDIINGIFSICEESAWQLPAHNTYKRDTPQLLLPDITAPVLDLFACETASILATTYYLIGSSLDKISPFITKRIQTELQNRIFTPYLNCHFWWMGNGEEPMNNWTIWCTQNVLLATFLIPHDEDLSRRVFLKACKSIDYFLDEYGEDGCCDEGAQYYRHAGLCLFNTMEILNAITNNEFNLLYQNPRIHNIATYILKVHIDDKYYVNFSDCSPIAGRSGVREFLFAKRVGNEDMARYAAADFKAGLPDSLLLPGENNLFYRLQNAFSIKEIKAVDTSMSIVHSDVYFPSVGVFIARDEHFLLAVKAGDNADSHNHNDTGSFTVYKDGQPMLIDIGVESYTKKTFSPQRYEIWTMQSAYHNLPTVNGLMQKDGDNYKAKDVAYHISDTYSEISMDISQAYPPACKLQYYKRHAKLIKGQQIIIDDQYAFQPESDFNQNEVILSLITYEKPVKNLDSTLSIGKLGCIKIEGGKVLKIEDIPVSDARLMATWKHEIYRILIHSQKGNLTLIIQ